MPVVSPALPARLIDMLRLCREPAVTCVATPCLAPNFGGARCRRPDCEQADDEHCTRQTCRFPTTAHGFPPVRHDVLDRAVVDRQSSYDAGARLGGAIQKNPASPNTKPSHERPTPLAKGSDRSREDTGRNLNFPRPFGERVPEGRVRGRVPTRNKAAAL
jgi:hypothetical protein